MIRTALLSLSLVASLACSSTVAVGEGGAGGSAGVTSPVGAGPSSVATGVTAATGVGGGAPAGLTISFGPVAVPPGTERTQCITKRLGNTGVLHVGEIHNELSVGSHHMIVYRTTATTEQLEPYDCQPFTDTLSQTGGGPIMITQKKSDSLVLPKGVAFAFDPDQMIRLEVHYINPTQSEEMVQAHATFVPMPDAEFQNEAGLLFAGTTSVLLPPNQATSVEKLIDMPADLVGKQFFGFTGHVHQMGTNVRVLMSQGLGPATSAYDVPNFTWSEPPTEYHDPPLVLPPSGAFDITCDYQNTSTSTIHFGESAQDEMCFFWAYYFPSVGPKVIF